MPWYRKPRLLAVLGVAGAALIAVVIISIVVVTNSNKPPSRASVAEWWSRASVHFQQIENAAEDGENASTASEYEAACNELHDAVAVDLQADMPTPDRNLTAAVQSMIDDLHRAMEICKSAGGDYTASEAGEMDCMSSRGLAMRRRQGKSWMGTGSIFPSGGISAP